MENKKPNHSIKTNKRKNNKTEKARLKKHASSEGQQSEICLSCWYSPSDFFLDLSLFFSQLQVLLSYSWKGGKKSHLLILGVPGSCRQRAAGLRFFSFPVVPQGWGSVWVAIITGSQFPAHTLRALCSLHCPLWAWVPVIHLILHPFDQSVRCTEWEQIGPLLLPLCWPGLSAYSAYSVHLYAVVCYTTAYSVVWKKVSLGAADLWAPAACLWSICEPP